MSGVFKNNIASCIFFLLWLLLLRTQWETISDTSCSILLFPLVPIHISDLGFLSYSIHLKKYTTCICNISEPSDILSKYFRLKPGSPDICQWNSITCARRKYLLFLQIHLLLLRKYELFVPLWLSLKDKTQLKRISV